MDQLTALGVARGEFERRLRQVQPGDWDRPTPCSEWNVRDLVLHVLGETRMAAALMNGCSRAEAVELLTAETLSDDPVATFATFAALADEQVRAFTADNAMTRTVAHPAGDLPAETLLGFRINGYSMHAWDLARAIGADETLPDGLVEYIWEGVEPLLSIIGSLGVFGDGPSGTVPEDAPLQSRLLDAYGRRP